MKKIPLVFLHGFPFDGSSWDPQTQEFGRDRAVYAPDLRGHGRGPTGPAPWFLHHFAEDLDQFFAEKKIDRAIVVGVSMGGYVALHFAQAYAAKLAGLVLVDTRADGDDNAAKDKRHATARKLLTEGMEKFAEDFSRSVLSEETLKDRPEVQKKVKAMIAANRPEHAALAVGALASRRDSTPYLKDIRCPTLVLVGREDKVIPPEHSQAIAKGIAGAAYHEFPGAGHLPNLEKPVEFNGRLADFLGEIK